MPPKTIVCTECCAGRANKKWEQSGSQFAAYLLVDDESPTPLRIGALTVAGVLTAQYKTDREVQLRASESSDSALH